MSQISQTPPLPPPLCWSLLLIKLQACNFIKKRLQYRCFLVKFAKFLEYLFYRTLPAATSVELSSSMILDPRPPVPQHMAIRVSTNNYIEYFSLFIRTCKNIEIKLSTCVQCYKSPAVKY